MTRVLYTARISSADSIMFCKQNKKDGTICLILFTNIFLMEVDDIKVLRPFVII